MHNLKNITFILGNDLVSEYKKHLVRKIKILNKGYVISFIKPEFIEQLEVRGLIVTDLLEIKNMFIAKKDDKFLFLSSEGIKNFFPISAGDIFIKFTKDFTSQINPDLLAVIVDRVAENKVNDLKEILFDEELGFEIMSSMLTERGTLQVVPLKHIFVDTFVNEKVVEKFIKDFESTSFNDWQYDKLKKIGSEIISENDMVDTYQYENTIFVMKSCAQKILEDIKTVYTRTVQSNIKHSSEKTHISFKLLSSVEGRFLNKLFSAWGYINFDLELGIKDVLRLMYQLRIFLRYINMIVESTQQDTSAEDF